MMVESRLLSWVRWGSALLATAVVGCMESPPPDAPLSVSSGDTAGPDPSSAAASPSVAPPPAPAAKCELELKQLTWISFAPSGKTVLTAATLAMPKAKDARAVDLWDLERGERRSSLDVGNESDGAARPVVVAYSPDGRFAVTGGFAGAMHQAIALWDLTTGATTVTKEHTMFPEGAAFSHDGGLAAVVGGASQLVLVALPSMKTVGQSKYSDSHAPATASFSKDATVVHHDIFGRTLTLYDTKTFAVKKTFEGPLAVSPDRSLFVVLGKNAGIYDEKGKKLRALAKLPQLAKEDDFWQTPVISPDGSRVALMRMSEGKFIVYDTATGERVPGSLAGGGAGTWSPDSKVFLIDTEAFDAQTLASTAKWSGAVVGFTKGHVALVAKSGKLSELDLLTGKAGRSWDVPERAEGTLGAGGEYYAHPRDQGTIRILRLSDGDWIELGVAFIGGEQKGFVTSKGGEFEGPESAMPCAEGATKTAKGVLSAFFGKRK